MEHRHDYQSLQRSDRRKVKSLLKLLSRKLEWKWISGQDDDWDYRNAARLFHETTGCSLNSAIRYFHVIEDSARWQAILGCKPTIKDRVYLVGELRIRLP